MDADFIRADFDHTIYWESRSFTLAKFSPKTYPVLQEGIHLKKLYSFAQNVLF